MNRSLFDTEKKQFEAEFLRELGLLTRLNQQVVMRIARQNAEEILPLYNGQCSGKDAARIVFGIIDTDKERDNRAVSVSAGWR